MNDGSTVPSSSSEPVVVLDRMRQQEEVWSAEDDWTGETSAVERRKRQNRLHQRIYRKRQKLKKLQQTTPHILNDASAKSGVFDSDTSKHSDELDRIPKGAQNPFKEFLDIRSRNGFHNTSLTPSQIQNLIHTVERSISDSYVLASPRAELLLTLIQFNVFRALVYNTHVLGSDFSWLQEVAISKLNNNTSSRKAPLALKPTTLQLEVEHHPWIDLFPFPELRDNMFRQGEDYDDGPLCHDLVELCNAPGARSGLIVWSEPWDPSSWEVTEEFAAKWDWLLRGCSDLLHSTNQWRRKRGEDDLVFDVAASTESSGSSVQYQDSTAATTPMNH